MKVAVFVDGRNFYKGWLAETGGFPFEWPRLMKWVMDKAGGDQLFGVFYYSGEVPDSPHQGFMNRLEKIPSFFIRRFPVRLQTTHCPLCEKDYDYLREKEVDTSIVADMVRMAALNNYDTAILVSGDADLAPALETVQIFGKVGWVATWKNGISTRVRQTAFGVIDMVDAFDEMQAETPVEKPVIISKPEPIPAEVLPVKPEPIKQEPIKQEPVKPEPPKKVPPPPEPPKFTKDEVTFMLGLDAAMTRLPYVGVGYFLNRWDFGEGALEDTAFRQVVFEDLVRRGVVEVYEYREEGSRAIRFKNRPNLDSLAPKEKPPWTLGNIVNLEVRK